MRFCIINHFVCVEKLGQELQISLDYVDGSEFVNIWCPIFYSSNVVMVFFQHDKIMDLFDAICNIFVI